MNYFSVTTSTNFFFHKEVIEKKLYFHHCIQGLDQPSVYTGPMYFFLGKTTLISIPYSLTATIKPCVTIRYCREELRVRECTLSTACTIQGIEAGWSHVTVYLTFIFLTSERNSSNVTKKFCYYYYYCYYYHYYYY